MNFDVWTRLQTARACAQRLFRPTRYPPAALAFALGLASCQGSDMPVGSTVYVGQREAPFCETADQLQDLLGAMQANDAKWIEAAAKNCIYMPEGTKLAIISKLPNSVFSQAVEVRVFVKDVTSTGYTITEGFRTTP